MDYREAIKDYFTQAVDGIINYSGDNFEQNKNSWVEIATDRAIGCVIKIIPMPVDVINKYEVDPNKGLYITLQTENTPESFDKNQDMMMLVAKYADDRGYNRYHDDLMTRLTLPYAPLQNEGMFANMLSEENNNGE